MVAAGVWCARALARASYDLALNAGLCGSFDPALPPGSVVHVVSDCCSELGAEDGEAFLSAFDLTLVDRNEFPYVGGRLVNAAPPNNGALARLPPVSGITVNTVHGRETSIARVVERLAPQVESMEGAAFMYACLVSRVPFAQVRGVSNVVERRNRAAWKVAEAIDALAAAVQEIVERA
jgi:futalosine hydrolase